MNNRTSDADTPDVVTLIKAALLFLRAFALYFDTRSPALDEQDSVQFAMGVFDFNLWKHQPHPPGYLLFIFWAGSATKFSASARNFRCILFSNHSVTLYLINRHDP